MENNRTSAEIIEELRLENKLLEEEKNSWKFKYKKLSEKENLNELIESQEQKIASLEFYAQAERLAFQQHLENNKEEIKALTSQLAQQQHEKQQFQRYIIRLSSA